MPESPSPSPEELGIRPEQPAPVAPVGSEANQNQPSRWSRIFHRRQRTDNSAPNAQSDNIDVAEPVDDTDNSSNINPDLNNRSAVPRVDADSVDGAAILEENRREHERVHGLRSNWQEKLSLPNKAEDIVHFASLMNGREFQQLQIERKHGHSVGKLRQILAGDLNFELDKEGNVRRKHFNELASATARVFDRGVFYSAGFYAALSILSGGFGIPGGIAVAGRVVGRAGVEVASYIGGEERRGQNEVAEQMKREWKGLQILSQGYNQETDLARKAEALKNVLDKFYSKSEEMALRETHLADVQAERNDQRDKAGFWGGIIGAAGGLAAGLAGMTNMIHSANFDADPARHAVRLVHGVWQYAQTAAEHATYSANYAADFAKYGLEYATNHAANTVTTFAGQSWHVMGDAGWRIAGSVIGGLAGAFGGFKVGSMLKTSAEKREARTVIQNQELLAAQKTKMLAGITETAPAGESSGGGESAVMEDSTAPETDVNTPSDEYLLLAEQLQKTLPKEGEIWEYTDSDPDTNESKKVYFRIKYVDQTGGGVVFNQVDANDNIINSKDEGKSFKDLLTSGSIKGQNRTEVPQVETPSVDGSGTPSSSTESTPGEPETPTSEEKKKTIDVTIGHRWVQNIATVLPDKLRDLDLPTEVITRKNKDGVLYLVGVQDQAKFDLPEDLIKMFKDSFHDKGLYKAPKKVA